ncbi:MAG: hypothetical protein IT384_04810 [Deltaproteobacteria bacterium]|nr:hypothetical protein [Deltaproteobacteria bacterium]
MLDGLPLTPFLSLLGSALALLYLQLRALPRARRQLEAATDLSAIDRATWLATAYLLRAVSFGALLGFLVIGGALSAARVAPALAAALEPTASRFSTAPGLLVAGALVVIAVCLGSLVRSGTRAHARTLFEIALRRSLDRLREARHRGDWPPLEPTPAIREVQAQLAELLRARDRLRSLGGTGEPSEQSRELDGRIIELESKVSALDLERRVDARIDPAAIVHSGGLGGLLLARGVQHHLAPGVALLSSILLLTLIPLWSLLEARALRAVVPSSVPLRHPAKSGRPVLLPAAPRDRFDAPAATLEAALGRALRPSIGPEIQPAILREQVLGLLMGYRGAAVLPALGPPETLPHPLRELAARLDPGPPRPRTTIGLALAFDLERWAERLPALDAELRVLEGRPPSQLARWTHAEIASFAATLALATAAYGDASPIEEVDAAARALGQITGPDRLPAVLGTASEYFARALGAGLGLEEAARGASEAFGRGIDLERARRALRDLPGAEGQARALVDAPAALVSASASFDVDAATRIIESVRRRTEAIDAVADLARLTESMGGFEDWLPAQRGRAMATPRGRLLVERSVATPDLSLRARNPRDLIDSDAIGGLMLSGRCAGHAEVAALHWIAEEGRIILAVRARDQRLVPIGAFDRRTIAAALGLAADQRPIAVLLAPAAPLADRHLLLHPALNDTALGCRLAALVVELASRAPAQPGRLPLVFDAECELAPDLRALTLAREPEAIAAQLRIRGGRAPGESTTSGAALDLSDPAHAPVLSDLGDLLTLVRLFRLAFSGGLGPDFDRGTVLTLAAEVAEPTPGSPTLPTWWRADGALETALAQELDEAQPALARERGVPLATLEALRRCSAHARSAASGKALGSEEAWRRACTLERDAARMRAYRDTPGGARWRAITARTIEVEEARRLRTVLGVEREAPIALDRCPRPE